MRLELDTNVSNFPPPSLPQFDEAEISSPTDPAHVLRKGIGSAQSGDRDQARKYLTQAVALDPDCEDAWMWLASISEYPEELLAFLDRVLQINPGNEKAVEWRLATKALLSRTFSQRGEAAFAEGKLDLSEKCVEQALIHDSDNTAAWYLRARMSDDDDQRVELLGRVLELDPNHADAIAEIVRIEHDRAFGKLEEARAAVRVGDESLASALVDEFLASVSDSVEGWILRSHLSKSVDEKVEALQKALEIDPSNAAARSGLDYLSMSFHLNGSAPAGEQPNAKVAQESVEPAAEVVEQAMEESVFEKPLAAEASDQNAEAEEAFKAQPERLEADELEVTYEAVVDAAADPLISMEPAAEAADEEVASVMEPEGAAGLLATSTDAVNCPFCEFPNEPQTIECVSCFATLTLADLEKLFGANSADHEVLQTAVTRMEAEWNFREFNETELTQLGLGHFNLGNYDDGLKYLQEAARVAPNNVVLAGLVNAVAIRNEEMRRQSELHESQPTGKTILVVDDSATVRKLISGKLEKSGHIVVCANDGVEALERLEEGLPDLVLLDITMPRMDGYEVCKQIRQNPSAEKLPVVMISGKDGFFDKVRGRMAGCTGYVTKPFGPETLMKALETYLLPEA